MKALYIDRHNKAVRCITKTLSQGAKGGCFMVMDACAADDSPPYSAGTRVPRWLIPSDIVSDDDLKRLRPELLLIPTISLKNARRQWRLPTNAADRSQHTVHLIEVGYCHDTMHERKLTLKASQHTALAGYLRQAGWQAKYSAQEAISLGVGGTIRKDLRSLLSAHRATPTQTDRCCNSLHRPRRPQRPQYYLLPARA